jgi:hypothetical protein
VSDIDTGVVDSLKALDPDGRLEKRKWAGGKPANSVENDPNVWSGRALQEDFFGLADLRSCINVSGL